MTVVETPIASDLLADEIGFFEWLVRRVKFYFRHNEPAVFSMEFIHFEDMLSTLHKIASLVNHPWFAECKEMACFFERDFLFEFIAAQSPVGRRPFYGEKSTVATDAHPDGASVATANVALFNMIGGIGLTSECHAANHEFPFYLHATHKIRQPL
jgi:hypothetical protein